MLLFFQVNVVNYKLNHYYYNRSLRKIYTYSLTERYQISENIQFAKVLDMTSFSQLTAGFPVLPHLRPDRRLLHHLLLTTTASRQLSVHSVP